MMTDYLGYAIFAFIAIVVMVFLVADICTYWDNKKP